MKQGKKPKGYEKQTDPFAIRIQTTEYYMSKLTTRFLRNKLSKEEIEMYKEMCGLIALAKSSTSYEECGKYLAKANDIKQKFKYIDSKNNKMCLSN